MPMQLKQFALLLALIFGITGCASSINISELKKRAESGDVSAQNDLGYAYKTGSGVEKNPKEAIKWIRRAADAGSPMAQRNFGLAYGQGYGVPQDFQKPENGFSNRPIRIFRTLMPN